MKVVTPEGVTVDLGSTETGPTVSIIDYSRRVTDDFGVTTVVERDFARRMAVRFLLATADATALQLRLADLRATAARWIADERFASLAFDGFYKDFEVEVAGGSQSYCRLTVEGLAASPTVTDDGSDPAPDGDASTLRLLQPVAITDAMLLDSNVAEDDAPVWNAGTTYPADARVILTATHRVYQSAAAGNVGNDPAGASGKWIDVGPTNRWAAFDQALGTIVTSQHHCTVGLAPGPIDAVALLDTNADSARVRVISGSTVLFEQVQPGAPTLIFTGLPRVSGARVEITAARAQSSQFVTLGTLLVGDLLTLGRTEASPTAGIIDYSRKSVDDFGEVTVVQRGWAKRMSAKALIRTDAVDMVGARIAAVRARPALWIGQDGLGILTIYGFYKDYSVEVGETTSKLALTIEGLSTAGKVAPFTAGEVAWVDVKDTDPARPKPQDGADVTGKNTAADTAKVNGRDAGTVTQQIDAVEAAVDTITGTGPGSINKAITDSEAVIRGDVDEIEAAIRKDLTDGFAEVKTITDSLSVGVRPNYVPNGNGELDDDGLDIPSGLAFARDATWGPVIQGNVQTTSGAVMYPRYRLDPGQPYTASIDSLRYASTGSTYVDRLYYDANGALLPGGDGGQKERGGPGHNFSDDLATRQLTAFTETPPAGAVWAAARGVWQDVPVGTLIGFRQVKVERGNLPATIYTPAGVNASYSYASFTNFVETISGQNGALVSIRQDAAADTAGVRAALNDYKTLVSGQNGALASLEQRLGTSIGNVSTSLTDYKEAISGQNGALAVLRQDVEASVGPVRTSVANLTKAVADNKTSAAQATQALSSYMRVAGNGLLNSDFREGLKYWNVIGSWTTGYDSGFGTYAIPAANGNPILYQDMITSPGEARSFGAEGGPAGLSMFARWIDVNGNDIGDNFGNVDIKGITTSGPFIAPPGARYIRINIQSVDGVGSSKAFTRVMANSDGPAAWNSAADDRELRAETSIVQATLADVGGRVQSYIRLNTIAGTNDAELTILSDANAGSLIYLRADKFALKGDVMIDGTLDVSKTITGSFAKAGSDDDNATYARTSPGAVILDGFAISLPDTIASGVGNVRLDFRAQVNLSQVSSNKNNIFDAQVILTVYYPGGEVSRSVPLAQVIGAQIVTLSTEVPTPSTVYGTMQVRAFIIRGSYNEEPPEPGVKGSSSVNIAITAVSGSAKWRPF